MDTPELSIIVVSYNTRQMTVECIESVLASKIDVKFEVLLWDNASSDDSVSKVESAFGSRIRIIKSSENLGFAKANNEAAKLTNGRFLLLLNPDTIVERGSIQNLHTFAAQYPNAGIWGGRTRFLDGSLNPGSCWSKQSFWSLACQATGLSSIFRQSTLFNPEGIGGWKRDTVRRVDIVSGCFLLVTTRLWNVLGGFSEKYFMYGEDADLCIRAARHSSFPMVTPDATIIHYGGGSEPVRTDKLIRLLTAKIQLINDHFHPATIRVGKLLLSCWPLSRSIAYNVIIRFRPTYGGNRWPEVWARRNEWMQ